MQPVAPLTAREEDVLLAVARGMANAEIADALHISLSTAKTHLASLFGAEVTGVCSTAKTDLVRSLGADHVIDYTREDFADGTRRYDLILDVGGNASIGRLRRALAPRGTLVFVGGECGGSLTGMGRSLRGALISPFLRQRLALLFAKESAGDYERLTELIEGGAVRPAVDRSYPLEEARAAMRLPETGRIRGKVVITI